MACHFLILGGSAGYLPADNQEHMPACLVKTTTARATRWRWMGAAAMAFPRLERMAKGTASFPGRPSLGEIGQSSDRVDDRTKANATYPGLALPCQDLAAVRHAAAHRQEEPGKGQVWESELTRGGIKLKDLPFFRARP
jgi:hypothetical protein